MTFFLMRRPQNLFQPTRPLRGATHGAGDKGAAGVDFNPRAPCGARLSSPAPDARPCTYFNPRAPCGARLLCKLLLRLHLHFNPRAPCGARPRDMQLLQAGIIFQPTRPLRGATVEGVSERTYTDISTHAPLAGRDRSSPLSIATRRAGFQPTRPLRGATGVSKDTIRRLLEFQPTRPLRGATPRLP